MARLDACTRDRFIDVGPDGRGARLAPSFLLTHEMGVTEGVEQPVTAESPVKVVFHLPPGRSKGATVLWFFGRIARADPKPMTLLVNGRRIVHRQDLSRMLTGGWDRRRIPASALRAGRNEIVFTDHGKLRVDPGAGGAGLRSFDGGHTWHANAFGPRNDLAGECMVRLRVHGRPPEGRVTSPVTDLADPKDKGRIAPRMTVRRARVAVRARYPMGTEIVLEMRSGSRPVFDPAHWTPWRRTDSLRRPGRFVQWRAPLKSTRMEATPTLTSVTIRAEIEERAATRAPYRVVEWNRPPLDRSSYAFTHLAPHPRAERLVKQYGLDRVVASGRTDLERLDLLRHWVHQQWYGWLQDLYPYCPSWDPIEILDTVKNNWGFGMCTHYASTFVGCAAALGYPARVVILDHHCIGEVWVRELGKWICMDPGPDRAYDALYLVDGKPANALEIHQAMARPGRKGLRERIHPQNEERPMRKKWAQCFRRFAIALRNDHVARPEPAEEAHGNSQYHWDGYLWWTDQADPKYPEYSLQTRRVEDFYWTVGLVRIHLQLDEEPNRLRVDLEHAMPNFDRYEVRRNRGSWQAADTPWKWLLKAGDNTLEARAVSAFGHAGPTTGVTIRR